MPDHEQAALEAAFKKLEPRFLGQPRIRCEEATALAIRAAEPHLRRKWATEVIAELDTALVTGNVYTYGDIQDLIREGAVPDLYLNGRKIMAGTPGKKNQNPILPPGFPIDNPALLKRAEEICGGMIPSHAYVRACKEHCRPPHMKRGTSCYEGLIKAEHEMLYELGYYR